MHLFDCVCKEAIKNQGQRYAYLISCWFCKNSSRLLSANWFKRFRKTVRVYCGKWGVLLCLCVCEFISTIKQTKKLEALKGKLLLILFMVSNNVDKSWLVYLKNFFIGSFVANCFKSFCKGWDYTYFAAGSFI